MLENIENMNVDTKNVTRIHFQKWYEKTKQKVKY